jgi:hypothetical protein
MMEPQLDHRISIGIDCERLGIDGDRSVLEFRVSSSQGTTTGSLFGNGRVFRAQIRFTRDPLVLGVRLCVFALSDNNSQDGEGSAHAEQVNG